MTVFRLDQEIKKKKEEIEHLERYKRLLPAREELNRATALLTKHYKMLFETLADLGGGKQEIKIASAKSRILAMRHEFKNFLEYATFGDKNKIPLPKPPPTNKDIHT